MTHLRVDRERGGGSGCHCPTHLTVPRVQLSLIQSTGAEAAGAGVIPEWLALPTESQEADLRSTEQIPNDLFQLR